MTIASRREVLRIFGEDRLVAVIRTETAALALRAARVLAGAGVRLLEITLTVPDAFEVIEALTGDEALAAGGAAIGAGTVLSPRQAAGRAWPRGALPGEPDLLPRAHRRGPCR